MTDVTYNIAKGIQEKLDYLRGLKANVAGPAQSLIQLPAPIPAAAAIATDVLKDFLVAQATVFIDDQIAATETDFANL